MLAIEPSMVNYFKAEQLAAMPDDVFAALPDDYIAGLDGITRDELAAKALARAITGENAAPAPVDLPSAWKIQPPQLITFSFDDMPLATYSISGTARRCPPQQSGSHAAATTGRRRDPPNTTPKPTPSRRRISP